MGSQGIALRLQEFWEAEGCSAIPSYGSLPVGGLTPDVFFGVLGRVAWCACQTVTIIDPSRAPYGVDPLHPVIDQCLQVTQQTSGNQLRDRFIESLQAVGLDLLARDVRFVACEWDQPHLDARTSGWRVLVDRIEVGSISYLHELSGVKLAPMPTRAEYSLGRLSTCVEGEDGDAPAERGRQTAAYALESVDPERIDAFLELHAVECERALALGLYLPAYEHVLASVYLHLLLALHDTRSAGEQFERVSRTAGLARGCASKYLEAQDA
ncbi:glycine--tRNA ligase subunit alpha [Candidatus Bipolaricaulota bacterium]|nr:glycine--tRNA ligase subunit alpha [Candidatus Bipolaricaulota bacterium]